MNNKTREDKFQRLQDLILDKYISALEDDAVEVKDLSSAIVFLKNNKVVETNVSISESDIIDGLIE
jgi:hypothetical protein